MPDCGMVRATLWLAGVTALALLGPQSGGEPRRFTLVYNVNNGGYVDVCGCAHKEVRQGSLTRRRAFLRQLRSTGREILLLDGGSALFPIEGRVKDDEREEAVRAAELIIEAYNRMGYQALAVGAFDLAAGLDTLKKLEARARFAMLSANLADRRSGKLYFEPHAVFQVAGLRVGVIGLTLATLTRPYLAKVAPDAVLLDPLEAAEKSYAELRPQADLVIALSHLREETNFQLPERLRGLEILVDPYIQYGNPKTWLNREDRWVMVKGDTLFLRSDGQGARLGVVDIGLVHPGEPLRSGDLLDELQAQVTSGAAAGEDRTQVEELRRSNLFRFSRISLEPHFLSDPEIDALVAAWKEKKDLPAAKPPGEELPRRKDYATHSACGGCHEKQYEFWVSSRHAQAYETLKANGDERRFECVGCHSLGYGQAFLDLAQVGDYAGVQCESCHGTSPQHLEAPAEHHFPKVTKDTCLTCHNQEVTEREFRFGTAKRQAQCPHG